MISNLEKMKEKTAELCPKQLPLLDRPEVLAFMEKLRDEFNKLGLTKKFQSGGLYSGIDFCYMRPIVLWTRTGYAFPKRMEDELFADCYIVDEEIGFEAAAPLTDEDFEEMTDEELEAGGMVEKKWPLARLTSDPDRLMREVVAEFKAFYRPHKSMQTW